MITWARTDGASRIRWSDRFFRLCMFTPSLKTGRAQHAHWASGSI